MCFSQKITVIRITNHSQLVILNWKCDTMRRLLGFMLSVSNSGNLRLFQLSLLALCILICEMGMIRTAIFILYSCIEYTLVKNNTFLKKELLTSEVESLL